MIKMSIPYWVFIVFFTICDRVQSHIMVTLDIWISPLWKERKIVWSFWFDNLDFVVLLTSIWRFKMDLMARWSGSTSVTIQWFDVSYSVLSFIWHSRNFGYFKQVSHFCYILYDFSEFRERQESHHIKFCANVQMDHLHYNLQSAV